MRGYQIGAHTKTDLKVHLIWIPKYRKRVLTGQVAVRARDILRQIAIEHEIDIITRKVASDHVHMFIRWCPKDGYLPGLCHTEEACNPGQFSRSLAWQSLQFVAFIVTVTKSLNEEKQTAVSSAIGAKTQPARSTRLS